MTPQKIWIFIGCCWGPKLAILSMSWWNCHLFSQFLAPFSLSFFLFGILGDTLNIIQGPCFICRQCQFSPMHNRPTNRHYFSLGAMKQEQDFLAREVFQRILLFSKYSWTSIYGRNTLQNFPRWSYKKIAAADLSNIAFLKKPGIWKSPK